MRVNVAQLLRRQVGILQRRLHHPVGAFASFGGLGDVEGVAAHTVADQLRQDGRAPPLRKLQRFQNQYAGAFTHHKAVAVGVEGAAGALGLVVAGGERAHGGEPAHTQWSDGGLGAAADHSVGVAAGDDAVAVADGMGAGRAGGGGGGVGALGAGADRHLARRQVDNGGGNEKRRNFPRAALEQSLVLALNYVEASNPRPDIDPGALSQLRCEFQPRLLHSEVGGGQGELDKAAQLLQLFLLHPLEGIEVLHLAGNAASMLGGVKERNGTDAVLPGADRLPHFFGADAQPAEQADAGDHHPAAHAHTSPAK